MRNYCIARIYLSDAKPSKSFVHLFKGGRCPEGKALGRSPQRAKLPKLWRNVCCNKRKSLTAKKGAIHIKKGKPKM